VGWLEPVSALRVTGATYRPLLTSGEPELHAIDLSVETRTDDESPALHRVMEGLVSVVGGSA